MTEKDITLLKSRDFSIVNSTRKNQELLMLGPSRFVNHDCNGNTRYVATGGRMTLVACRIILVGEEITVSYGDNYFGMDNRECLCATCERNNRGRYAPDQYYQNLDEQRKKNKYGHNNNYDDDSDETKLKEPESIKYSQNGSFYPTPSVSCEEVDDIPMNFHLLDQTDISSEGCTPSSMSSRAGTPSILDSEGQKRSLRPRKLKSLRTMGKNIPLEKVNNTIWSFIGPIPKKLSSETNDMLIKRRFRILDSFTNTILYNSTDKSKIYECDNCGTYYSSIHFNPPNPKTVMKYCPRCYRHANVYDRWWPLTVTRKGIRVGSNTNEILSLNQPQPVKADFVFMKRPTVLEIEIERERVRYTEEIVQKEKSKGKKITKFGKRKNNTFDGLSGKDIDDLPEVSEVSEVSDSESEPVETQELAFDMPEFQFNLLDSSTES